MLSKKRSEKWLHLTEERAQVFRSSRQDFCAEGLGTGAEIYLRRGSRSQSKWKRLIVFSSQYVAELTATTCCGWLRSTWIQKTIRPLHRRKSHKAILKTEVQFLQGTVGVTELRVAQWWESGGEKSPSDFSGLYTFLQVFMKSHRWRQDTGLDGYLVVLSRAFLMSFVGKRKWTFANTRIW